MGELTGFLLNWVAARTRASMERHLADCGLTPPQFFVLTVIAATPGMTQQELVTATGIDASTMVATVDALEGGGHAERRAHPTDRRKWTLHLTAAGEKSLGDGRAAAGAVMREHFAVLSAQERRQLNSLLRRLAGLTGDDF
jgi:DNA-binding MarR family transcriptional regulator